MVVHGEERVGVEKEMEWEVVNGGGGEGRVGDEKEMEWKVVKEVEKGGISYIMTDDQGRGRDGERMDEERTSVHDILRSSCLWGQQRGELCRSLHNPDAASDPCLSFATLVKLLWNVDVNKSVMRRWKGVDRALRAADLLPLQHRRHYLPEHPQIFRYDSILVECRSVVVFISQKGCVQLCRNEGDEGEAEYLTPFPPSHQSPFLPTLVECCCAPGWVSSSHYPPIFFLLQS
ncbi:hypothetical protein Pcinc_037666 [Petrolisthes cinctipes]|uniref:Uncharacterized protein n=1 Tax=Petrolisthes cinctipes TaxID=88211 RepID=A0AAE1BS45_PETCI|nr:hypothetical protein Pcinc_037666 [Petrolisthes cinctipes]